MSLRHECYFGEIPEKFKSELVELYKTPYCTIEYLKSFYGESLLNCFSIHEEDKLIHLILFTINRHDTVTILNRVFEIDSKHLIFFSNFIFNSKLHIAKIQVNHLINQIIDKNKFPYICNPFDEDYILKWTESSSDYFSCLSPKQRYHTKNSISKIVKGFGNYSFNIFEKNNINESLIKKIIEMNFLRMMDKNVISGFDYKYVESIIQFVKYFGFVSVLEINNEIVAGTINYSIGNNFFQEIISSDPKFNKYNVGHICQFLTIKNFIESGGNEFHLLWGNSPYKQRLLAERYQLYSVTIFNTHLTKLKFEFIFEIIPCLSPSNILKLCKRRIKKILGQRVLENFKNLGLRKNNNKIVD